MTFHRFGLQGHVLVGLIALMAHNSAVAQPAAAAREHAAGPDFGPNVLVFEPSMADAQARLDAVFKKQETAQFEGGRYALLFRPGTYRLEVQVGFYTQVAGLGQSPDDVVIDGAVRSNANWMKDRNATCNFWRSMENLSVMPAAGKPNVWAVSQGTGVRRVHMKGDIDLWDGGWSSGGLLADSKVDGNITSGSQQQWMSRNAAFGEWRGGNWNMVFVGVENAPAGAWPAKPYTVVEQTPLIREKPYVSLDEHGAFVVRVPALRAEPTRGVTWGAGQPADTVLSLDTFHIATVGKDSAASMNAALAEGKNLLVTPGVYHLDAALKVSRPGTVVLGLGYPTLIPDSGTPAMMVADVDGVEVSGLMFDAGAVESPVLVEVGPEGAKAGHRGNPVVLHDICCRAGGAAAGSARSLVTINSGNVIGDNLWLWRADHGAGAGWTTNRNRNGLIVNGADVTIYGLFVEHSQEYQTLWNGEAGRVYFYQSEMPYDPPAGNEWSHDGVAGYASYKVAESVKTHEAWGLGVYCYFNETPMIAESAIEAPAAAGVQLHHMIAVRLNGVPESGIRHVLNGVGGPVITTQTARLGSNSGR